MKSKLKTIFILFICIFLFFNGDFKSSGMIFVKGGSFIMGDEEEEDEYSIVKLDDFWIGIYEVTQDEWIKVMGNNPSRNKGGNLPVDNVTWYDAVDFCNKKSIKEGLSPCYIINKDNHDPNNKNYDDYIKWTVSCDFTKNGYRLPTEAEWVYAAMGGADTKKYIYSGSNNLDEVGWYYENSDKESHPAGQKKPNELGLYDMSGNIWEWCWDWYDTFYYNDNKKYTNPRGPESGKYRVIMGGCMNNKAYNCEIRERSFKNPGENLSKYGLRLVKNNK